MTSVIFMKTMADVIHAIKTSKPFTPAFEKKVLGSIRRMPKMAHYGIPLEQIPADLAGFDDAWGRGPVRSLPRDFKSKGSFSDWRSQVRSAICHVCVADRPIGMASPDDDWSRIALDLLKAGVY